MAVMYRVDHSLRAVPRRLRREHPHKVIAEDEAGEEQQVVQSAERSGEIHRTAQREQKAARDQPDGDPRHDRDKAPLDDGAHEPDFVAHDVSAVRLFYIYSDRTVVVRRPLFALASF
ncbi:hypothetical protein SDC9_129985 [bioreactor metagenome]|uniref:Uncharacterized protein n=1 Tax=bioreactor metagenome TaxID=1076179 RepID=A0A645D1G4_9ZZZZ